MSTPTFVVGTGRCGSTMLSNMLREHPKVLSLSEFFSNITGASAALRIDGRQFWSNVAATTPLFDFAFPHGVRFEEALYPFDSPDARYSAQTGIPAILLVTLPHLTADYDALFDILRDEVTTWSFAPVDQHYRRLFGCLAKRFGKRTWIERSGASLTMVDRLLTLFPEARIVHVVRDGRDSAMSMREQQIFRLSLIMNRIGQALGVDPLASTDRTHLDRVPRSMRPFLPEHFDIEAFRAFRLPPSVCGDFWTQQILHGLNVLKASTPDRLLTLRYEDFFADPKAQLDSFAAFLGDDYVDGDWSSRCAATVRPPRSTWRDLPKEDARALTEACRPGFELLCKAGVEYEF